VPTTDLRAPRRRRRAFATGLTALALALGLLAGGPPAPTKAAAYDHFYANFAGEELMRAMNLDRVARGLAPLSPDSTLEGIARDRALACPSNPSLTIRGRARDMADRQYLSHSVKGCTKAGGTAFTAFDLVKAFGYTYGAIGEDISDNNYPASATSYATGCALGGGGCHGSTTLPWTVAVTERGFMNSSQHRANILSSSYGRFGCAAWNASSGYHYYACYFVASGNGHLDGAAPWVGNASGVGAVFRTGSTPTFTAAAYDGYSLLSDGYAAIDGVRIRNWAWDHIGLGATLSARAPALRAGKHTFTWWVRDASGRARVLRFSFSVSG
jgi:uncharacterized protein YkwD